MMEDARKFVVESFGGCACVHGMYLLVKKTDIPMVEFDHQTVWDESPRQVEEEYLVNKGIDVVLFDSYRTDQYGSKSVLLYHPGETEPEVIIQEDYDESWHDRDRWQSFYKALNEFECLFQQYKEEGWVVLTPSLFKEKA